eukprot:555972-Pelagomonas_calceolata.AAC.1
MPPFSALQPRQQHLRMGPRAPDLLLPRRKCCFRCGAGHGFQGYRQSTPLAVTSVVDADGALQAHALQPLRCVLFVRFIPFEFQSPLPSCVDALPIDVTNTTRKQPASSKKVLQPSKEPAAVESTDSEVTACSTETVKGSCNEQASGAEEEQQAVHPAALPEAQAQQFDHEGAAQEQQVQPVEAPHPALTPERAPQQPTHVCMTASKAEQCASAGTHARARTCAHTRIHMHTQGQGLAASKTPRTTVKQDAATPALRKPEQERSARGEGCDFHLTSGNLKPNLLQRNGNAHESSL